MTRSIALCTALLASTLALSAHAQQAPAPGKYDGTPPKTVSIKARTNPGDLPYDWVFTSQKMLQGFLPGQRRMVDFSLRITFTELSPSEQDAWVPQSWAVALVGHSIDQTVPVARGGYFLLPALPYGQSGATVMFHEQSLPGYVGAAWRMRIGQDQRLSYAGFAQAVGQIRDAQLAIPIRMDGLRQVRTAQYDALKACFLADGGRVLLDDAVVADASSGNCVLLRFDPALAASGKSIEFKGPLDVVTVIDSSDYRNELDLPALVVAARGHGDGEAQAAASEKTLTNLSNLSYGWNFKRQLRLQDGMPGKTQLLDFVWRLSLDGMSEAERDAWTPRDWVLAIAGKDFVRAVPVARGGYFLLPTMAPNRQDASLVFREQDKRNLVSAAWVVRVRTGTLPYLYYGEIKEAMDAVRKMQDAIPDAYTELAALRSARYDGLKICFLNGDGMVYVNDALTTGTTVGNCQVLKFNPAENVNKKIEFVGKLDAVTVVDTAPYMGSKK